MVANGRRHEAVVHGLQVGALHAADGVSGAAAGPGAGGHDINGSLVAAITAAAAGGAAGAAAGVAGAAAGAAGAAGALDGAARNASAESGDEPRPFRRCFCDSSPCPLRRSRRQRNRGRSPALRARLTSRSPVGRPPTPGMANGDAPGHSNNS